MYAYASPPVHHSSQQSVAHSGLYSNRILYRQAHFYTRSKSSTTAHFQNKQQAAEVPRQSKNDEPIYM